MRIAGIAGGVGTTVAATVLGGIDQGRDLEGADLVVARNDYRCFKGLYESLPAGAAVLLIIEPGRSLQLPDLVSVLHPGTVIHHVHADQRVARADDAGLLHSPGRAVGRYRERLQDALGCVHA